MTSLATIDARIEAARLAAYESGEHLWSEVAAKLVAALRSECPDELAAWLDSHAEHLVVDRLRYVNRRTRKVSSESTEVTPRRGRFAAAVKTPDQARGWLASFQVSAAGAFRSIRDMTGADHQFLANTYKAEAKRPQMLAKFHEALAKKVGTKRTHEVMDEETYFRLRESIVGRAA